MSLTVADVKNALSLSLGYCPICDEISSIKVEPDAQAYPCEHCGKNTVIGTEDAVVSGLIHFI